MPVSCPHASAGFSLRTKCERSKWETEEQWKWGRNSCCRSAHCPSCTHKVSLNGRYFPFQDSTVSQKFISSYSGLLGIRKSATTVCIRNFLISDDRYNTSLSAWRLWYIELDVVLKNGFNQCCYIENFNYILITRWYSVKFGNLQTWL